MSKIIQIVGALILVVGLSGCSADNEDLQQWMADQRRQTTPKVTPLTEPTRYVPLAYAGGTSADAFSSERLTQVLRRESGPLSVSAALVAPELNRRKEPLEAFPLDSMTMVGSLSQLIITILMGAVGLIIMKQDNTFDNLRQLWLPFASGLTLALLMILSIDLLRLQFTGTWSGFPGLSG